MNKIKFEEFKRNWFVIVISITALVLLFFLDSYKLLQIIICVIAIFPLIKLFIYKNYVLWGKKQINIRVNSFWGKSISAANIENVVFNDDECIISDHYGYEKKINLKDIDSESKARLKEILEIYVN